MSRTLATLALLLTLGTASEARTLVLRSGKILEVEDYRIEGEDVVIVTKRGKERRIARSQVVEAPPEAGAESVATAPTAATAPIGDGSVPERIPDANDHRAWQERAGRLQARVDAARARLDELARKSDAANGDVDTAGDGTKIEGMRAGRGYYAEKRQAEAELARAQAALDRLREQAAAAGVPPGVVR